MLSVRKEHLVFGWGDFTWLDTGTPAVAAYWRSYGQEKVLIVNNLSLEPQLFTLSLAGYRASAVKDMLTGKEAPTTKGSGLSINMQPYQYLWLELVGPRDQLPSGM